MSIDKIEELSGDPGRILFICSCFPYPPTDGIRLRVFHSLDQLVRFGHKVTVLCLTGKTDTDFIEKLRSLPNITVIPVCERRKKSLFIEHMIFTLFSKYPFMVSYYNSFNGIYFPLEKELNNLLSRETYDLIYVADPYVAHYAKGLKLPKVLDSIDCQSSNAFIGYTASKNIIYKLYWYINYLKWKDFERHFYYGFDCIITTSNRDTEKLHKLYDINLATLPNGIDTSYFKPLNLEKIPHSMLFLGTMDAFSNQDAVISFVEHILPKVKMEIPLAKLFIVGKNPSPEIMRLNNGKDIIVTGYVDDVRPYVDRCDVMISPLNMATGIQNKILVGMAMNKPIVSTRIGVGDIIDVLDKMDIAIADDMDDFANKTIGVLKNDLKDIGIHGRNIVELNFSWSSFGNCLNKIADKAMQHKPNV